jgi:tRNA A37 methylthiotransferase MiaB
MMIWREEEILISWEKEGQFFGRTRNFKEVFFKKKEKIKIWDIVKVKITEIDKYVLKGELVD